MLRLGTRSGLALAKGGLAEANVLPSFLCPRLINVDVNRIRNNKRNKVKQQRRNFASTSKQASLTAEIDLLLRNEPKSTMGLAALVAQGLGDVHSTLGKGKLRESRVMDDLAITQEVVEDIVSREQAYDSKAETTFVLHEGYLLMSAQLKQKDEAVHHLVQLIAPKLAFAFLKLDRVNNAITITQETSSTWTEEIEEKYSKLWKPVVSLAYKKGLYNESNQLASFLSRHSRLSGNWMSLARLQSLLRMAEASPGARNRDNHRAETIWEAYEEKGLPVPETAMSILLDSQVRRRDMDKMTQTLEAMKRYNIRITTDIWRALLWYSVRGKSKRKMLQKIMSSLDDSSQVVEELLHSTAENGNLRDCLRVLRTFGISTGAQKITSTMVTPTLDMYSSIIKVLCKTGRPLHAIRFLDLAIQAQCQGDYTPLYFVIKTALNENRNAEEAVFIGVHLINSPYRRKYSTIALIEPLSNPDAIIAPSQEIYSAILESTSYLSNINAVVPAARVILLEMFSKDLEIDDSIRKALSKIVTRLGRGAETRSLVRYLQRLFFHPVHTQSGSQHDAAEWRKFTLEMQREGVAEELTIEVWKKTTPRSSRYIPNVRPWTDSKDSIGVPFHGPLGLMTEIDHRGDSNENIRQIAFRDLEWDVNLSPAAYAMRLRVFAVLRREFGNALIIYQSMIRNGVRPSMNHVTPLVEGLVLVDRLADALMIKDRAKEEFPGTSIPVQLYAALVRGYAQRDDWQGMMTLAAEMRRDDIKINRSIHIAFLRAKQMLRREEKVAGGKGDIVILDKYDKLVKQPLPTREQVTPMGVLEATMQFDEYQRSGQLMTGQLFLSKALDEGLEPDAHLRDQLGRADNWIRKKVALRRNRIGIDRQRKYLERCLVMCRKNRQRMKMSPEQLVASLQLKRHQEIQRGELLRLLKEAVGSRRLWDEAHSEEYRNTISMM